MGAVAAHLGRRIDKEDKAAVRKGKELDKTKDALVDALTKKAAALAKLAEGDASKKEELAKCHKALGSWVDTTEAKLAKVTATYEKTFGRYGSALAAWNKHIGNEAKPGKDLFEERARLFEELGWTACDEGETIFVLQVPEVLPTVLSCPRSPLLIVTFCCE